MVGRGDLGWREPSNEKTTVGSSEDRPPVAATGDGTVENDSNSSISPWSKYGSIGRVVRSQDFYVGIPLGIAAGAIPTFSNAASGGAVAILITFAGVLVAIATVVLAAVTLFAALMSPEYRLILERTRGGVKGAVRPYFSVVLVCVSGIITSLVAALGWPALPDHVSWLKWLTFSVPACFTMWAIIGSVQLVWLGNYHIQQRAKLISFLEDVRRRRSESRSA